MNRTKSSPPPWYTRTPVRKLAVVASLSLATLAVVLAFEHANPAPPDMPSTAGPVAYVDQLGDAVAREYGAPASNDATSAASGAPVASRRDPSVPALSFVPNAADAQEPRAPTF
jgi:hypothetical protein